MKLKKANTITHALMEPVIVAFNLSGNLPGNFCAANPAAHLNS